MTKEVDVVPGDRDRQNAQTPSTLSEPELSELDRPNLNRPNLNRSEPDRSEPDRSDLDLSEPVVFQISPLIRLTLLLLYAALMLPLPILAGVTEAPVPVWALAVGVGLGAIALYAALSEQVIASETQLEVAYPAWTRWVFGLGVWRRGWSLRWPEMTALKPRSTGQGGIVYYFLDEAAERAFLLPMRIAGFARLTRIIQAKTQLDTRDVKPLAQPWMYLILLGFTLLLFLVDGWVLWTGLTQGFSAPGG